MSNNFRYQLRHEAQLWQAEGLIDDLQYAQLSQRYQFNTLDTAARNSFLMILVGLGSILIGLGVITFVAANWQLLPRVAKVLLLLSLFIGVNVAGFYLWKQPIEAQQRRGHGLLLLGALILGANMGLMGQMFHISAPFYQLLLAWGIGVLAMAYSLRLTSLGVLSIILVYFGYWGYVLSGISPTLTESWSSLIGQHLPLLIVLVFVPLAYWCQSAEIFTLSAIALISSLEVNLLLFGFGVLKLKWLLSIACALPPALLWGYNDSSWVHGNFPWRLGGKSFQPLARKLAVVCLGILFYCASFEWFWQAFTQASSWFQPTQLSWLPLIDAVILTSLAIWEWLRLARRRRSWDQTTTVIGIFICIAALIPLWHTTVAAISVFATVIFNVMLFGLAAGLIQQGLTKSDRHLFWSGIILITLRILNWFLLTNTGLLLKSLIFILCGVAVIAVGFVFERYLSKSKLKNEHHL